MADGDLCTVDQVNAARRDATGGARDAITARYIAAASRLVRRHTGRQFVADDDPSARRFSVHGTRVLIDDLSSTPTLVRLVSPAGVSVAVSDAVAWPRNRPDGEPITALDVAPHIAHAARLAELEVTGVWGWPEIPVDVGEACVDVVCEWLDQGAAFSDNSGDHFEPGQPIGRALTLRAKEILRPYRRRMGLV